MQREQTVFEMVQEVLGRQAKYLADQTARAMQEALSQIDEALTD